MLVEFSVENYRSIKDRVTLSLVAANLRSRDPKLDAETTTKVNSKLSLLRSAVVYGANASGKSNLFHAFTFIRHFVANSVYISLSGESIDVVPFRLSTETVSKPCTFEVVFLIDGLQYRYGFSVTTAKVLNEWLYYVPSTREVELFTREGEDIHTSSAFHEGRGLNDRTRDNSLFLTVVAQFNGKISSQISQWLVRVCAGLTTLNDSTYMPFTIDCIEKGMHRDMILDLVRRLDVDISDLSVGEVPAPFGSPESRATFSRTLLVNADDTIGDSGDFVRHQPVGVVKALRAHHAIRDESGKILGEADFSVDEMESEGTKKLIALAGPIVDTLTHGRVLFVDEIDARLHPLLTVALLDLFNSSEANPKGAQLICATHDTNLLDRRHFRRDQIYFVEKDRSAATRLFSLADFKLQAPNGGGRSVRNDASYERNYIQGRYGAIPFIGDLQSLFAEEFRGGTEPHVTKEGALENAA